MTEHPIGVNLSQIGLTNNDEYAFKDLMKASLPFFVGTEWNGEVPDIEPNKIADLSSSDYNSNRYPIIAPDSGEVFRTIIGSGTNGTYAKAGDYYLLYEGTGTIRIYGDTSDDTFTGSGGMTPNAFSLSPSSTGLYVDIENTSSTGITKIVIIPQRDYNFSCYLKKPFDPKFQSNLKPYQCIRFKNWNLSTDENIDFSNLLWTGRPTKDVQTYSVDYEGVPWEEVIELCNILEVDPWICVDHRWHVDPTYYTNLATLFRDNLDPSLTLTVEYSTDTWVPGTPQYTYCLTQANAQGMPGARESTRVATFYGQRSAELFIKFTQVFGSMERLNFAVATTIFDGENNLFKRMTPDFTNPGTILSAGYIRQQAGATGIVDNSRIHIAVDPLVGKWLSDDQDPDFSPIFPGIAEMETWGINFLDLQLRSFGPAISYDLISGSAPVRTGGLAVVLAFASPRNYGISFLNGPIHLQPKNAVASNNTIKNLFTNYMQSSLSGQLMVDLIQQQRTRVQNAGLQLRYIITDKLIGEYNGLDNAFLSPKLRGFNNPHNSSRYSKLSDWIRQNYPNYPF